MNDTLLAEDLDLPPSVDPEKDYLSELVGDGKKFKTAKDLARGKYEADMYVETLKKRSDDLRADYLRLREESMSRAKLEELIDQLSKQKQNSSNENTPPVNDDKMPGLDLNQIESLISNKMEERDVSKRQSENFNMVKSKLKERYGNNYNDVVKEQIQELGITEAELNDMAKRQPKVLLKTLGLDQPVQQDPFRAPPRGSQRSDSFADKTPKRTWAYYQNLKKTNPNLYLDPKTAVQMYNDYKSLGTDFEDGDFKAL